MRLRCVDGPCRGTVYDSGDRVIDDDERVLVENPSDPTTRAPYRVEFWSNGSQSRRLVWDPDDE